MSLKDIGISFKDLDGLDTIPKHLRRFGKKNLDKVLANKMHPVLNQHIKPVGLPRIIASYYPYSLFPTTRGWAEKQHLGDLPYFAKFQLTDLQQFQNFCEEAKIILEGGETPTVLPSTNSLCFPKTSDDINTR